MHGYVGNKAAVFPLQLLGHEVDPINSVQFSNHTGYDVFTGHKLEGDEMLALVDGLRRNDFLRGYSHLLTGYIGSISFLRGIVSVLQSMRDANEALLFVCDPVLGDGGKLYVPDEFVAVYRTQLLPHAFLATPNQTEAEFLTETKIDSLESAHAACQKMHSWGVQHVVITSIDSLPDDDTHLHVVASSASQPDSYIHLSLPKIETYLSGTGDALTALLLAHLTDSNTDLKLAVERSIATIQAIIQTTINLGRRELALVQSHSAILSPQVTIQASVIS